MNKEQFKEWIEDGNVVEIEKDVFTTQCCQYRNRIVGLVNLYKYFLREFVYVQFSALIFLAGGCKNLTKIFGYYFVIAYYCRNI